MIERTIRLGILRVGEAHNYSLSTVLMKGFCEIRSNLSNVYKLEAIDTIRRGKSRYPMRPLGNEVKPPYAIAEPLVELIPEADHDVNRVDSVGAGIGPVSPVMFAVGSGQRVDLKALRYRRLIARVSSGCEQQEEQSLFHGPGQIRMP
jgi:hypothetical protein